jgi:hypothetical protein
MAEGDTIRSHRGRYFGFNIVTVLTELDVKKIKSSKPPRLNYDYSIILGELRDYEVTSSSVPFTTETGVQTV